MTTPGQEHPLNDAVVHGLSETLHSFPAEVQQLVIDYLKQFEPSQQIAALDELIQLTWRQNPVAVREFIEHGEYLNLKGHIWPRLIDDLEELFNGQYVEAILTGGIGWGKSSFARLVHCYMLHQLGCLMSPAKAFGLEPTSRIVLINLAINKTNAREVVFHQVQAMVDRSPWFNKYMVRVRDVDEHLEFENGIWLAPFAASEKSVAGFDAFGGVMDEVNEMAYAFESTRKHRGELVYDQAQTIRDAIVRRMTSRFVQAGSRLPGILVQLSSSKYPGEYTERRIKQAKDGDTTIFWRQYASWETNPSRYSPTTFRLALGTMQSAPFVIANAADEQRAADSNAEIVNVPDNLKTAFDSDIHAAIRDFVGRSTAALSPFITQVHKIFESFQRGKAAKLEHPFPAPDTDFIEAQFSWETFAKNFDPLTQYFAHGDLAKNKQSKSRIGDRAGLAIGHVAGIKLVTRLVDGVAIEMLVPHYVIDLIIQVKAPLNDEIRVSSIKAFFKLLRSRGVRFRSITFDQWQSLSLVQDLTLDFPGAKVEEFSVDRSNEPYTELRDALYEDRLDMYEHVVLQMELTALERNMKTGIVDHPPKGSKDCSDAVAAICYRMLQFKRVEIPVIEKMNGPTTELPEMTRLLQLRDKKAIMEGVSPQAVRLTDDDILFGDAFDDDYR